MSESECSRLWHKGRAAAESTGGGAAAVAVPAQRWRVVACKQMHPPSLDSSSPLVLSTSRCLDPKSSAAMRGPGGDWPVGIITDNPVSSSSNWRGKGPVSRDYWRWRAPQSDPNALVVCAFEPLFHTLTRKDSRPHWQSVWALTVCV